MPGADGVYAAGDVTTFPLKQGGLATQQADAAAEAMLAALGVPIVPRPFEPVLKGVLYTDRGPAYLRARRRRTRSEPRPYSMWWPPSKIAGRHLAPYLATRAGAPRAPEVRPERDAIAVTIDVPRAVRAVASALDASAVPPADPSAPLRSGAGKQRMARAAHGPSLDDMPRIIIAGGGIAGLEALIALRGHLGPDAEIELLEANTDLVERQRAVAEPFGGDPARRFDLVRIAADHGAHLRPDRLSSVDPEQRRAHRARRHAGLRRAARRGRRHA